MRSERTRRGSGSLVDRVASGARLIGVSYTVRIHADHAVVFVSAPDPASDGRPSRALAAFRVDVTRDEVIGCPGPVLVRMLATRMATAAQQWEQSMTAGGPRAPGGAKGAAVLPGQMTLPLDDGSGTDESSDG